MKIRNLHRFSVQLHKVRKRKYQQLLIVMKKSSQQIFLEYYKKVRQQKNIIIQINQIGKLIQIQESICYIVKQKFKILMDQRSLLKKEIQIIKTQQMIQSIKFTNQIKRKPSEVIRFIQINKPILRGHRRYCECINFQTDTIREDEKNYVESKLHNSNPGSHRTSQQNSDDGKDDLGSLSPRKLKIYPGYKLQLYVSEFEKNENQFKISILYSSETTQLLKFQITALINFLDLQQTNKIKV